MGGCGLEFVEKYVLSGEVRYKFKIKNKKIEINVNARSYEEAYRKAVEIAEKYYGEC